MQMINKILFDKNNPFGLSIIAVTLLCFPISSSASKGNRNILEGWWDEGKLEDSKYFCQSNRNLHKHKIDLENKRITWIFQKPYKKRNGQVVTEYSYTILSAQGNRYYLTMDGEQRITKEGNIFVWNMVVEKDQYKWRATHWPPNKYASVIGVRCLN